MARGISWIEYLAAPYAPTKEAGHTKKSYYLTQIALDLYR